MMEKQPEVGEFYTRNNGKVYEVQAAWGSCGRGKENPCAFIDKKHCTQVLCDDIIYIRRKDLEA